MSGGEMKVLLIETARPTHCCTLEPPVGPSHLFSISSSSHKHAHALTSGRNWTSRHSTAV